MVGEKARWTAKRQTGWQQGRMGDENSGDGRKAVKNMAAGSGYALSLGSEGALQLIFLMGSIVISWYALGNVRWEIFAKHPASGSVRILRLIVAILLGTQLSDFFMQYVNATILLRHW
ncbi:DUF1146 domain-containing protein [Fodinisporobacter ferrooxydans]|uniref:DUF1146 domain-containing protein n=1 Tax=Fodinisporobacter ferrooxydans TaxID=2901836 RepID=A0ABY4CMB8_9BACL|nr:DUF1146 domain-containing protein [Alicyclobacillaceae bacterium MYW30-H2]